MIEVNLLPVEFRPREKTNLPLMVTIAAGLLVFGGVCLWAIKLTNELAALNSEFARLADEKVALDQEVKEVRALKAQIAEAKARQNTIIEISQSKIMWSLKLQQFSNLIAEFPGFWLAQLTLNKSRTGGQSLTMQMSATGSSLREVARFRHALKNDPNFFYHFEDLVSPRVAITPIDPGYNYTEKMDFQLTLPLKSVAPPAKGKKGRR